MSPENYRPAPGAEVVWRRRTTSSDPLEVTRSRMGVRVFVAGTRVELRRDIALQLAHDIADALTVTDNPTTEGPQL